MAEFSGTKERIIYYDYIRVFATCAVILLHAASWHWADTEVSSVSWCAFNFYESVSRWGVPAFVMISGALFLPREIPIKKIYTKYISRLAVSYFVWAVFYAFLIPAYKFVTKQPFELSAKNVICDIIRASYHMWFIPMIIGLYMFIPLFQKFIASKKLTQYFLLLAFVFVSLLPFLYGISRDFIGGAVFEYTTALHDMVQDMQINLVAGYAVYFILGYYLSVTEFSKKQRLIIYLAGAAGFAATVLLDQTVALKTGKPCGIYYDEHYINVMTSAAAVFVWCKYNLNKDFRCNRVIAKISSYSYGAYLVHIAVITIVSARGFSTLDFNGFLSTPALFAAAAAASFLISFIIHKIPVLNKWIV